MARQWPVAWHGMLSGWWWLITPKVRAHQQDNQSIIYCFPIALSLQTQQFRTAAGWAHFLPLLVMALVMLWCVQRPCYCLPFITDLPWTWLLFMQGPPADWALRLSRSYHHALYLIFTSNGGSFSHCQSGRGRHWNLIEFIERYPLEM